MKKKIGQLYESMAYWGIPPGIQRLCGEFIQSIQSKGGDHNTTSDIGHLVQRNSELQDRHKGERCFILATGPSVNNQDLTLLQGELCISVSHFFLHKDIRTIAPRYHVLAPYHHPFTFTEINKVFDGFNRFYPDDMIYLFGHYPYEFSVLNFLHKNPIYARKNTYFINYAHQCELDDNNYMNTEVWDITKTPFRIRTVIYTAIQAAVYMGCKEIYLVGCDHDYLSDMKRVTNHHFYREKDGVSDVEHLRAFTTERWFQEYYMRWKQYRLMREYLEGRGCKIVNATKGGLLDVFPKVDLEELCKSEKGK